MASTRIRFIVIVAFALPIGAAAYQTPPAEADKDQPVEVTSLRGQPLRAAPPGDWAKLEAALAEAEQQLAENPDDPDRIIWVARRLGYLWRMNESAQTLTAGIEKHPDYAPLMRHRGHRYISLRRFDDAIADLDKAARLIEGQPDQVEQDGAPNARNIPLTTLAFNVWYHLGVAHYLKGDYDNAHRAWRETAKHTRNLDDNTAAVIDWTYMTLRRMGRDAEANALLAPISPDMDIIENHAYHRRCLLYKGLMQPDELLNLADAADLDIATLGYGLGNWHLCNGDAEKAKAIFQRVTDGRYWPAFGYIASEIELARMADTKGPTNAPTR